MSAQNQDAILARELLAGESVIWVGRPDPSVIFAPADKFLVPFTILWAGFACVWTIGAVISVLADLRAANQSFNPAMLLFPIPGLLFVCVGAYITIGRFIVKRRKKERMLYAVTNKRVLAIECVPAPTVKCEFLTNLGRVECRPNGKRHGYVLMGAPPPMNALQGNTGMDFFMAGASQPMAFYDVVDPQAVYRIILQAKEQASGAG